MLTYLRTIATKLLRCDTVERCQKIQKGNLFLKRLGKYSVLFTIAVTTFLNDVIAMQIDIVTGQYESARGQYNDAVTELNSVTGSVLYRWTFGWFQNAPSIPSMPELDHRAISFYNALNLMQFVIFVAMIVWSIRWVYADCVTEGGRVFTFGKLMAIACVTNLAIYLTLRSIVLPYIA